MAPEQQPKPVQLCVFDTEHDYPEGEEAQRILAYYPPDACSSVSFVRAEALCTAPQEATCDSMHAQRHVWAFCRLLTKAGCHQPHLMLVCVLSFGRPMPSSSLHMGPCMPRWCDALSCNELTCCCQSGLVLVTVISCRQQTMDKQKPAYRVS